MGISANRGGLHHGIFLRVSRKWLDSSTMRVVGTGREISQRPGRYLGWVATRQICRVNGVEVA